MIAADIIARRLYEAGCRHAFGIPGGEVLTMMNALNDAGIEFVLTKHENNAGFMAEGTHHVTGAPGILLATLGPGVANAANVVANAYQDQVPLIFLTGCIDPHVAETYTHQIFDHGELLKSVTKASLKVVDGAVDVVIDKAVSIAMEGRPGPVHVDIPISVAGAEQSDNAPVRRAPLAPTAPAEGPELEAARAALAAAERPVMMAGVDILHHYASEAVQEFVERFQVPLLTTYKAKGVLPEDHPLALGGAGLSPRADGFLQPIVDQSDLVILAGYDPIEMRSSWCAPWDVDKMVIDISAVANTHYVHQSSYSFVCNVGAGLKALGDGVAPRDVWSGGEPAAARAGHKDAFRSNGKWGPEAIIEAARRALPRDAIATVDTGAHRILLSQGWESYGPRQLLQSTALCTMGVAMPMAVGAKLADPAATVVAFSGDAGMEMVLGDLATVRDQRLGIPIVIFVDESLALIEQKQRERGMENLGVDFGATNFPAVAEALGGVGAEVADGNALEAELAAALRRDTFTLIACPIGAKAYHGKL